MENKKAKKLIEKILSDLDDKGIDINNLIEDLQALRPYAVEEKIPLLAKVIRLTFEHLQSHEGFGIPIPDDEPIEETNEEGEIIATIPQQIRDFDAKESLKYLISLMQDMSNKINLIDLRAYCNALIAYE